MRDPIYHFAESIIIDDVVTDIINCAEFKRLIGIKQAGITGIFTERSYNRYEHSLGVYFLLKFLGASLEQCVGGLLHDIYHTNFSHTTDELFCGASQESFHERNKYIFFNKCCGNIIQILSQKFPERDYSYFLDGPNMLITKNKSFGADMIDYILRDGFYEGVFAHEWIDTLVNNLSIIDGRIVLNDRSMSRYFVEKSIYINEHYYMSPFSRGQYVIFTRILRHAIKHNIVSTEQLIYGYKTDYEIYNQIKNSEDETIASLITMLETITDYSFTCVDDKEWKKIAAEIVRKPRFLNPICHTGVPQSADTDVVSTTDKDVRDLLEETNKQFQKKESLYVKLKA